MEHAQAISSKPHFPSKKYLVIAYATSS